MIWKNIAPAIGFIILASCTNKVTVEDYRNKKISEIIEDAFSMLDSKSFDDAAVAFKSIDDLYPYSASATSSQVFEAYSLYCANKYQDAVRKLEIFMKYNPMHELIVYAMYLRGLCFLKQVCKIGRSQTETLQAKAAFIEIAQKFPDSDYAKEAEKMILKLDNALAASEMNVAKYYQMREHNLVAAVNRYSVVIAMFPHTNQAPEALYRMLECYAALGLHDQARNAYKELIRLFRNTAWGQKAHSVNDKLTKASEHKTTQQNQKDKTNINKKDKAK